MSLIKPAREHINPSFGSSFTLVKFDKNKSHNTYYWHYHPEIELVYVNGGSGKRQIGSHISHFTHGDLILIGSNLPHCGFTDKFTGNKSEIVIQFQPEFIESLTANKPEMQQIRMLIERSKSGLAFTGKTKTRIGARIQKLVDLEGFDRFLGLLSILNDLQLSEEYQLLNASGYSMQANLEDNERINRIFNHVKTHFQEAIVLEDMAGMAGMTTPSFCRYFKKVSGKTFTSFVNEYRLVHASKLLSENSMSITEIAFESGFNNFSYFNKSFKKFTGKTPSEYRNTLKQVISAE
ncbi:AraC family transcriptional regulator [Robertkochia marina]|uniref:AraC family transcriptional regulator n=1 Tax=Robertkochia marina TaxID=1227945 RepID=A0A4S3LX78_9FLAO|nr:AraC family transcriptional regulator [Robertkochia marina]THD65662.1 AraC family transcriptional regulator [Robertkochia marina]TRZ46657.1 AraC family transcriptional regulator [Robertkochia marina]